MELHHYIQSGIIESYVLGLATADEVAELQQVRRLYPELDTEIATMERRLERVAFDEAVWPPDLLKQRVLQRVDWKEEEKPPPGDKSNYTFINIQPRDGGGYITVHKWWKLFFILVFILSKLCLFFAIYFFLKYRQLQERKQEQQLPRTEQGSNTH